VILGTATRRGVIVELLKLDFVLVDEHNNVFKYIEGIRHNGRYKPRIFYKVSPWFHTMLE
jgi:hypothetical protein